MAEYIEREALLNNRPEGRNLGQVGKEEYNKGWNDCRSAFFECIEEEPAADVAPVVHGQWGKPIKVDADNVGYKCSNCGEFGAPCWNFCPCCGANMEGKSDEV